MRCMPKLRSDKEVIVALDGPAALAAELEYSEHAVAKWMNADRGIPWKDRPKVYALAKKRRVTLPQDFLQERRPA